MFKKKFDQQGTFAALYAAQKWLTANGYSYSSTCAMHPVAILKGDYLIAKWRNLTEKEIQALDGRMDGDFRDGPVWVVLDQTPMREAT
ncbi:hypothetical protein ASF84_05155 [Pseudomonas sp. Leaf127]|uniref:hypothetical protein n=1 Tax=Pseudomonas sp. Leaf127 TaxID=1736267 RepID=UPI0007031835|nr:hypothetical protein [Pseudomonas sp. Leaf127]KQQ60100.1 hypothetical protein ASF84_05155 [Pseudomonas sp. Leaf127]